MGLLDRLSYRQPEQIPRNWDMTSLDATRIEERNSAFKSRLELQPTKLILGQPHIQQSEVYVSSSGNPEFISEPTSRLDPGDALSEQPKKKRFIFSLDWLN